VGARDSRAWDTSSSFFAQVQEETPNLGTVRTGSYAVRVDNADELVRSVLDSMDAFSGGVQTDDATVAVLRAV
jgi:hypothetical protein